MAVQVALKIDWWDHDTDMRERIKAIELPLMLEAIYQHYGYDFRGYAPASMRRRVQYALQKEGLTSVSTLQNRILHDVECMARFVDTVTIEVTALFRDPSFYQVFRNTVVPELRALPRLRFWHAGCSTGEEVYSMAILLHEEGLLKRSLLYATDLNERALERGRAAIIPAKHMRDYTANYQKAGGKAALSDYYTARHEAAILREFLRKNIVWSTHNLATDSSFNEFNVILCRNVMIYFGDELRARTHSLIYDSLAPGGILGLGRGESLQFTPFADRYEVLDRTEKLYRRVQ